jgi:hypothetical protein
MRARLTEKVVESIDAMLEGERERERNRENRDGGEGMR